MRKVAVPHLTLEYHTVCLASPPGSCSPKAGKGHSAKGELLYTAPLILCSVAHCTSMLSTAMVPLFSVPSISFITRLDCGLLGSAARSARLLRAVEALELPAASNL